MTYRPETCKICHKDLVQPKTGRPRKTCSDRCRQILRRRYDYYHWMEPRAADQRYREAERTLRRIERRVGPIDNSPPPYKDSHSPTLSVRERLVIRLAMGQEVPECRQCWKPYILGETPPGFCSKACRKAWHDHDAATQRGLREHYWNFDGRVTVQMRLMGRVPLCEQCGKPFPRYYPHRKYCSDACRKRHWEIKNRKPTKRCAKCGVRFKPARSSQIYCSVTCRGRVQAEKRKGRRAAPKHHTCTICGIGFLSYGQAKGKKKYCSDQCKRRADGLRKRMSHGVS